MPSQSPLAGVQNLETLLARLPDGPGGRAVAVSLGAWTPSAHAVKDHPGHPSQLSELTDDQLIDAHGVWASRLAAVSETVGLLEGQKVLASMAVRAARAAARAAERRRLDDNGNPRKLTATALDDEVAASPAVREAEEAEAVVEVALASARAYKEASSALSAAISRAISLRQAQYSVRLR